MAAGISFKVQGLENVLSKINSYSNKVQEGVDDVLTENSYQIEAEQKALSPIDDSNLRQNIGFKNEPLRKEHYSNATYSAYLEFGTGAFVDVPEIEGIDLPAYARTFFVNGKGHIAPHPYFFPAVQAGSLRIVAQIKKVLEVVK